MCGDTSEKKNNESGNTKNKDVETQKTKTSRLSCYKKNHEINASSEGIEEMVCELEGYRWDAIFLCDTWRQDKSEVWETHHKRIFTEEGKYDDKHGVGIMLNKKWRQRIVDIDYINELAITATIGANRQRIKVMSVYVILPLGTCGPSRRKNVQNDRGARDKLQKIHTFCWRRLQCGHGTECTSVGRYTVNEGNKKGD